MDVTDADKAAGLRLHRDIQMVLAGHPLAPCGVALTNSMSAFAAVASSTIEEADRFIDLLAGDLKEEVRLNWDYVQSLKAQPPATGRG